MLNRQLESVPSMSRMPHNAENDERNVDGNNLINGNFRSYQNLTEHVGESPHNMSRPASSIHPRMTEVLKQEALFYYSPRH